MKKFLAMLAFASSVLVSSAVFAGDLPAGWEVASNEDNSKIFVNKEAKASVSISSMPLEGEAVNASSEELAKATSAKLGCGEVEVFKDDSYQFICEENGTVVVIANENGAFNMLTLTASDEAGFDAATDFVVAISAQ
jgi:hypothetical protein